MLPIDPATIDPEDLGAHRMRIESDHEAAVETVREAFVDAGFGVPVEFSPSELLNEKVDAGRDPYYVLGACNPEMADRALDVTKDIGGLFPCNVIVHEVEPGVQEVFHLSIMKMARLVGVAPDDEAWASVVEDTGTRVADAMANLERATA
jgi:Uncharacterized conserved protein